MVAVARCELTLRIKPHGELFWRPLEGFILFTCELASSEDGEGSEPNIATRIQVTQDPARWVASSMVADMEKQIETSFNSSSVSESDEFVNLTSINRNNLEWNLNLNDSVRMDKLKREVDSESQWTTHFLTRQSSQTTLTTFQPRSTTIRPKSTLHWLNKDGFEIKPTASGHADSR